MLNTLPKAPSTTATPPSSRKYSQPSSAAARAGQSVRDSAVNIPPRTPTITTAKKTNQPATAHFERIRLVFGL